MFKVPLETIILKIKEKTGLSDKEIKIKIKDKLDLLSGLISEEGAAHILANEMGVKIYEEEGKLQIKNILPGMRSVEVSGKVVKKYEVRSFEKENRKGKIGAFLIGDETGIVRVVAWNDKADLLEKINENDAIKIQNGYSRDNQGRLELHLGDKTNVTILPADSNIVVKERPNAERKQIKDLKDNEENAEIMGTIVQVFDPKFFEVCPQCNKRVKPRDNEFFCDTHNSVTPAFSYVVNVFLDDGTDNVRVVLWKNQAQRLFNLSDEQFIEKKNTTFEDVKNDLLGKIVKLVGRTNKNAMFDRLEFIPQLVFTDPNPNEEIDRLKKEIEKAPAAEKSAKQKIKIDEPLPKAKQKSDDLLDIDDLSDLDSL